MRVSGARGVCGDSVDSGSDVGVEIVAVTGGGCRIGDSVSVTASISNVDSSSSICASDALRNCNESLSTLFAAPICEVHINTPINARATSGTIRYVLPHGVVIRRPRMRIGTATSAYCTGPYSNFVECLDQLGAPKEPEDVLQN